MEPGVWSLGYGAWCMESVVWSLETVAHPPSADNGSPPENKVMADRGRGVHRLWRGNYSRQITIPAFSYSFPLDNAPQIDLSGCLLLKGTRRLGLRGSFLEFQFHEECRSVQFRWEPSLNY